VRSRAGSKGQREREAAAVAKKQRRQKVIAFGGLGVLAILLVIQGPRLLDAVGGSSDPAATALPAPVVATPPPDDEASGDALRDMEGGGDPFAVRALANNDPQAGVVSGPGGAKDPFAQAAAPAPAPVVTPQPEPKPAPAAPTLPKRIVVGTPKPGAVAKRGWIVVLASIQTRLGRTYADRFAARVEAEGLEVSVLDSSTRKPLRSGYYVVYTGPFATLAAVQRSAAHVRAFGYRTAYVREILRY
jgi:hypothetical protein